MSKYPYDNSDINPKRLKTTEENRLFIIFMLAQAQRETLIGLDPPATKQENEMFERMKKRIKANGPHTQYKIPFD